MSMSRYDGHLTVSDGKLLATNVAIVRLRDGVSSGAVSTTTRVLTSTERLDIIAHRQYGDARLWWVIATVSGIGWWLQAPPGTRLVIPQNLAEVEAVL